MDSITITDAQYGTNPNGDNISVKATINNITMIVPIDPANTHYGEIIRQVHAGQLTIKKADSKE